MPDTTSVKPTCEGTSKKTGKRCTAYPANGGTLCAGHAHLGVSSDPATYSAIGGKAKAEVARERAEERKKTLLDRIAEGLEERAQEILTAYMAAGLEKGDWRALEALVTRVHGKPVERVVQVDESPDVADLSDEERDRLRAWAMERVQQLRTA